MSVRSCLLALVLAALGCAHTRLDEAERKVCYGRVCYGYGQLGAGWETVHAEGAMVGYYNADLGAIVQSNATCRDDADPTPLAGLTNQLLIGYTERAVRDQRLLPLAGREALRTRLVAKLDGVPVLLDLIVLKRDGCVFDLLYVAPPERYEAGRADFERFVRGFEDRRKMGTVLRSSDFGRGRSEDLRTVPIWRRAA